MMNKHSFVAIAAIISIIGTLYFYKSIQNSQEKAEYELLAVADHQKFASGQFYSQIADDQSIENSIFNTNYSSTISKNSSSRNILVPAISAVAIAKFLNGNLPTTTPTGNIAAPTLLSQTGAFTNLTTLEPTAGLIPYDMIEPFWSDGASKKRWMVIPNDGTHDTPEEQIQFSQDNAWNFPKGTVLIKHFEFPGKRLETRFEVKGDDDVYYYLTYKWNAAQTDATLLNNSVDEDIIVNGQTQSWHYPSRNECASCHFSQNGNVLGPKTRNLNKAIVYPSSGVEMNQLVNLSELGILTENITNSNAADYPAVTAKNDLSASLEDRARSYIDVNCASCHNPNVDNVAMFDARYSTPLENQNIIYGNVVYDEGLNDPKVIIPQDVSNSMVYFRMNSTQTGIEMPPLAKDVVDTQGVQLIADWINSLTPTTSSPPVAVFSASTTYGSAPLSISFDASASSDPDGDTLSFSWDFGDGITAQGEIVNHMYANEGSYTATLTVNDGLQSDQETTTIVVNNSNPGANTVAFTDGTSLISQDNFSGLPMGVIDMNGDGKDDIVQFNSTRNLRIQYQNGAGQAFSTYNYGQVSNRNQWSTAIADFDQNGYNDILSGGAYDNLKIITNNNGNDSFSLATLPNSNIFIQGSNFADINNDGWADIFACHDDAESRAYQNNQDGTFTFNANLLDSETSPTSDNSGNYASMWVDYDNDGDLDLYISKCRGGVTSSSDPRRINMLMQNDGNNNFTEVAGQANLKIGDQTWLTDFGDIDNDGDLDAIVINHGTGPNLMRNNGNGTFTEVTSGSGLLPTLVPQGFYGIQGFFRDFNNDGHLDLMVSGDNHYIFYNNGDGTFQNATNPFNSNQIQSFSVGDINHDGFLDIYAGYANGLNSPSSIKDRIWLNEGNSNNFLNIQLKGTESNINGIGARVELYGAWGIQIRDVRSGEGYGLVNSFTQHFGIGASAQVEKVIVRWPSGIVDEIPNPNINQFLTIVEDEELRENIALNKNALQSSTSYGGNASKAVDGNTNGVHNAGSVSHTGRAANQWWKVDLGNTYKLSTIKIFNRTDCCSNRLNEAKIFVGTINSNDPADYQEVGILNADTRQDFNSLENVARYVMIYQERTEFLSLAEVEVYGELVAINVTGVDLTPASATITEGTIQLLNAVISPENAADKTVTWSSSDINIATVDANGLVSAIAPGNVNITVTTTDGDFDATSSITIERAVILVTNVSVSPEAVTLENGATQQLTATVNPADADNTLVTWSSSNTHIATVDANGLVNAIAAGNVTITVTTADGGFTAQSNITVIVPVTGITINPESFDLEEGNTRLLSAEVSPLNASDTSVTWSSNDTSIATVNANGSVSGIAAGTAIITATTTDGGFTAEATVTVVGPVTGVTVSPQTLNLVEGASATLTEQVNPSNALDTSVTWFSSDANIATVNANGSVTAIAVGNTTITVTTSDGGFTAEVAITVLRPTVGATGVSVNPNTANLNPGNTTSLSAVVSPSNASNTSVTWASSDTNIATVDSNGLVTAIAVGNANITVTTTDGGYSDQASISITEAIVDVTGVSVNLDNVNLKPNNTTSLTAVVSPSNANDTTVTWASSDTNIATVDTNGLVTAVAVGNATITVTTNDGNYTAITNIIVEAENGENCSATGSIIMRRYDNIPGITLNSLFNADSFPDNPSTTQELDSFEIPAYVANNYGAWINGFLCAPETGTYYFWISGDDHVQLNLSTDNDAANKTTIAFHNGHTNYRMWDRYDSQQSIGIELVQGETYYIESFLKEGVGGDHLAVGWRKPSDGLGEEPSEIIPGNVLSPNQDIPYQVAVTGVSLNQQNVTLIEGNSTTLSAQISPSNAENQNVTWQSSDNNIATVDDNGNVTAIAAGNATITVTTDDGGFTAQSNITVREENNDTCTATGTITMRRYDNIGGITLNDLFVASNFPDNPSNTVELSSFEIPTHVADNYGTWVSGYLCAPETGTYYFWVSGDNHVQLNLSTDDDMSNIATIAFHNGHTNNRIWDKYESQKSVAIELVQGQSYYIEAYLKELNGGDHLAVGWSKPSDTNADLPSEIIPGSSLSPNSAQSFPLQASLKEFIDVSIINIYPNPTSEFINIETSANKKIRWMYIYDTTGKAVLELPQSAFQENQQNYVINVSHLAQGIYTIILTTDDLQEHAEKIIIR